MKLPIVQLSPFSRYFIPLRTKVAMQLQHKIYILLRKDKSYPKWHGNNISTTEYGVLVDFPFCGPIHLNLH
jgi:hypothetical protein